MTVVVGVDGLPDSLAAIRLARQEAAYRGTDLVAVMAYSDNTTLGTPGGRPLGPPLTANEQRELAETTLRAAVADALGAEDGLVELRTVVGVPGRALVGTARDLDAQLMVLATRREHSPSRLLGAVSQYVLRNAPCPVLVVPGQQEIP
jgi:nucleotide-binding universal stress UspA family protein